MYIEPENPIVKQTLDNLLKKDLAISEFIYDYDGFVYLVQGMDDCVTLSLQCSCADAIYANGGSEMLQELYPEFVVPRDETDPKFDLTLRINTSDMPKTQKVGKSLSEEEQQAIRDQNDQIRQQRQELCDQITARISKIKKDFLAAPIRKAMKATKEGAAFENMEIPYRPKEKYWVISPGKD